MRLSFLFAVCTVSLAAPTEWLLPDLPDVPRVGARTRIAEGLRPAGKTAPSQSVRIGPSRAGVVEMPEAERPCSIPLTNMLRRADPVPPMRRFQPPPAGSLHMRDVPLPAPSCDDIDRR